MSTTLFDRKMDTETSNVVLKEREAIAEAVFRSDQASGSQPLETGQECLCVGMWPSVRQIQSAAMVPGLDLSESRVRSLSDSGGLFSEVAQRIQGDFKPNSAHNGSTSSRFFDTLC